VKQRAFGRTGLCVSELGVGCSRLGGLFSRGSSRKEEIALVHAALDSSVNFFDTSDWYSQGQSEVLLGEALKGRRGSAIVATKGGFTVPPGGTLIARLKPYLRPVARYVRITRRRGSGPPGAGGPPQNFSPEHLSRAVDASLRRLGTDYIDIYQLHSPPRPVIDAGEYLGVLADLQAQGKIRHYGIAADDADAVENVAAGGLVASVQVPLSLLDHSASERLLPAAESAGVAVIARSCYAAGLFNEKLSEEQVRKLTPDWQEIMRLRAVARTLGRPLLEAALQFDLGEPGVAVTIVGMRTRAHLESNLGSYRAPALSDAERRALVDY
jgi:aryl-alcohol dehydrogenase-like predicted oxidoreductase